MPVRGADAADVRDWPSVKIASTLLSIGRADWRVLLVPLLAVGLSGCLRGPGYVAQHRAVQPLTASAALGRYDPARDASLRLVIEGLEADEAGRATRALASYQRAVRVDATNPFAFLALARHHLEAGAAEEAGAFLDQARSLFEAQQTLGPEVDVWGLGLRAGIDRSLGRDESADALFEAARTLSPRVWRDERLSAGELAQ